MAEQILNSKKSLDDYKAFLDAQFEKHKYLRVTSKTGKQRTLTQNSALHLYCTMLSDAFNDAGLDMLEVLAEGTSIPWSAEKVKDDIWRKVQIASIGKKSTADLDTNEVGIVYDIVNRHIGSTFGIFVPWPSKAREISKISGD